MQWRTAVFNPVVLALAALSIGGFAGVPALTRTESKAAAVPTAPAAATATMPLPAATESPTHDAAILAVAAIDSASTPFATAATSVSPIAAPASPTALPAPNTPIASTDVSPMPVASPAAPTAPSAPIASIGATPSATPARPAKRIGLQAGHWRAAEHPDELASLRGSTGAAGSGWTEMAINLDIARRAAALLQAQGFQVDLLPATVPQQYKADAFLSLHGDANSSATQKGFKVARATRSAIPAIDDQLVAAVYNAYGRLTGMPRNDNTITNNMRYYYSFTGNRLKHIVAPTTPAAILEMGFLTNAEDRTKLQKSPDLIAQAIATSLSDFLNR